MFGSLCRQRGKFVVKAAFHDTDIDTDTDTDTDSPDTPTPLRPTRTIIFSRLYRRRCRRMRPLRHWDETDLGDSAVGVEADECLVVSGHGQETPRVRRVAQVDVAHRARAQREPRHWQSAEPVAARRRGLGRRGGVRGQLTVVAHRHAQAQHRQQRLRNTRRAVID